MVDYLFLDYVVRWCGVRGGELESDYHLSICCLGSLGPSDVEVPAEVLDEFVGGCGA